MASSSDRGKRGKHRRDTRRPVPPVAGDPSSAPQPDREPRDDDRRVTTPIPAHTSTGGGTTGGGGGKGGGFGAVFAGWAARLRAAAAGGAAQVRAGYARDPRRTLTMAGIAAAVLLVGVIGMVVALAVGVGDDPPPAAAPAPSAPAPAAPPAPADPHGHDHGGGQAQPEPPPHQGLPVDTVNPGPEAPRAPDDPAVPNSPQGVDPVAMLDHLLSERKIPITAPEDKAQVVAITDEAVARDQPDFAADDPRITEQVAAAFPGLNEQQRADTVRCIAEAAERLIAAKRGTIPPDEADGQPGFGGN